MKLSSSGDAYFQYDQLDPYMIKQQNIYSSKVLWGKKDNNNDKDNINELDPLNSNKLKEINLKKRKENNINEKEELKKKDYNLFKKKYKSFFPSSNQLKLLELKFRHNDICFLCKTSSSGIKALKSSIYLWPRHLKLS